MVENSTNKINLEQQQVLDQLISLVPASKNTGEPDFWNAILGISKEDIQAGIQDLLNHKDKLENYLLDWVEHRPLDSVFEFLVTCSLAFYAAEKDQNPKICTLTDAFYYISTCASVGYADIFAVTQVGRAIASLVMIIGPAISSHSLDRPGKVERIGEAAASS